MKTYFILLCCFVNVSNVMFVSPGNIFVSDIDSHDFLSRLGESLIQTTCSGRLERAFRCLGADLREFLSTLDGVHDVLQYQGQDDEVHETAFVVTSSGDEDLELHFTTDRPPVAYLLVGSLKEIARRLYDTETQIHVEQIKGDIRRYR